MAGIISFPTIILACDDHNGECEIEAWISRTTMDFLIIEGSATCNSGIVNIRLYDGDTYLGNALGYVEGHALNATATGIDEPDDLQIRYSIEKM